MGIKINTQRFQPRDVFNRRPKGRQKLRGFNPVTVLLNHNGGVRVQMTREQSLVGCNLSEKLEGQERGQDASGFSKIRRWRQERLASSWSTALLAMKVNMCSQYAQFHHVND